jgi:hypothetical protein
MVLVFVFFFFGPIVLAYISAVLVSKLFGKRKALAKLVSWTILFPLLFSFGVSCYAQIIYSFEPHRDNPGLMYTFSQFLIIFATFPANAVVLLIWLMGATLMLRKGYLVANKSH